MMLFSDAMSPDEVVLEALQMDTVEWNPGETNIGVHAVSQETSLFYSIDFMERYEENYVSKENL